MRTLPLLIAALLLTVSTGTAEPDTPRGARNPLVGQAFGTAQPVTWMTKDKKPFRFKDKPYTLLRWWTNACPHCSASLPALAALERKYAGRGLRLVAVYHPKGRDLRTEHNIRAYLGRFGFTGDVAADPAWVKLKDLMARGKLTRATSVSFLVDAKGIVRWVHPGPRIYAAQDRRWAHAGRDLKELDALLDRLLPRKESRIFFHKGKAVWSCAPDGSGAARVNRPQSAPRPRSVTNRSPGGSRRIAWYPSPGTKKPTLVDLVIKASDGSVVRRWRAVGAIGGAAWSPGGRRIAFVRAGRLLRVDAAGGEPVLLQTGVGMADVDWR